MIIQVVYIEIYLFTNNKRLIPIIGADISVQPDAVFYYWAFVSFVMN